MFCRLKILFGKIFYLFAIKPFRDITVCLSTQTTATGQERCRRRIVIQVGRFWPGPGLPAHMDGRYIDVAFSLIPEM